MKCYFKTKYLLFFVILLASLISCTKYDNPPVSFEDYEQGVEKKMSRKVLLISVDGLVGKELEKEVPFTISRLLKNSKYSFSALSDEKTYDAPTWASMLTAYRSDRHHIINDNYLPEANLDDPHGEVNFTPSIIYRIKDVSPTLRTGVIVQNTGLANVMLMDADDNFLRDSDEKVKDEAVKYLETRNPDLLILQFTDVLKAGQNSSFSADDKPYADAIVKVDEYIGEVIATLENRPDIEYEDWLIIITSNHGGFGNEFGGESYAERNIFSLFYHKDIQQQELNAELISSPRLYGYDGQENGPTEGVRARNTEVSELEKHYNASETGELTVEAKIKINKNKDGNWSYSVPPFLSKTQGRTGTTPGWSFFRNGNNVAFWLADGSNGIEIAAGPVSTDDQWAHIAGVIKQQGDQVYAALYLNGVKATETTKVMNIANVKSSSPLTFGFQPYVFLDGFIDLQMADVRIWNKALDGQQLLNNARMLGVEENHSLIDHLKGAWMMDDQDGLLRNKILGMPDVPLQGPFKYNVLSNNLPYVDESEILLTNTEIGAQVLYWLEINIQDSWALDGDVFLSQFEIEFLK